MKGKFCLGALVLAIIIIPQLSSGQIHVTYVKSSLWLLKTDSLGDTVWTKTYEFSGGGRCVQPTQDEGYIIAAREGLIKTDSLGDTLWTLPCKAHIGLGECLAYTSSNNYVLTGSRFNESKKEEELWLLKADSLGKVLWEHTYDFGGKEEGFSITETNDGGFIIVGDVTGSVVPTGQGLLVLKTTVDGDSVWSHIYEGKDYSSGHHVQPTSDGGYVLVGTEDGDMLIIKTDSTGEIVWKNVYGKKKQDQAFCVREISGCEYLVTGDLDYHTALLKLNSQGDVVWEKRPHLPSSRFQVTKDGGLIFTGSVEVEGNYYRDLCILKLDSSGQILWKRSYGGHYSDGGRFVQQTSDGGYVVVGDKDARIE